MAHKTIRGVVFDLDGVLINSTAWHRAAFEKVLKSFGIVDFDYSSYAGCRTRDVIEDVFRRAGLTASPEIIAETAREKTRLARSLLHAEKPLVDACRPTLAKLALRYRLALATSGSRQSGQFFLHLVGCHEIFQSVLSGDEVVNAKPHPEIYLRTIERLGLEPFECVIVEDSISGIEAGHAAGAIVVGVTGTCSEEELIRAGVSGVIHRLADISRLLSDIEVRLSSRELPDPRFWTAVIPAAGRGSRLGYSRPKILYPIAGRPILDWLLDFLSPNCSSIVVVVSCEGKTEIAKELDRRIPGRFEIVVQKTPTGMGDAVALALPSVITPYVAIVWGDQVSLRRESVEECLRLHQGRAQPDVTCPTVIREHPYVHFERDAQNRIIGVRQAREGDVMPDGGESDTGFFCFRTPVLERLLGELRASSDSGKSTGEFNFLPVIVLAARQGSVLTPQFMRVEETVGVNSKEDATAIERFLRGSHVCNPS
jgi:HAD superfamily hydrolase (TIGR01509 family)